MRGAIPKLPQYVFVAWYLVKHRGSSIVTFMSLHVTLTITRSVGIQICAIGKWALKFCPNSPSAFITGGYYYKVKVNLSLCLIKYYAIKPYPLSRRRIGE
jgi:hypothetical protein